MDEQQRLLWLMSMPATAEVNNVMVKFSNVEQEIEIQPDQESRRIRKTLVQYLTFYLSTTHFRSPKHLSGTLSAVLLLQVQ